jgi:hypothetical protein
VRQEIGAAARELAQLGHRRGMLGLGQLTTPDMMFRGPVDLSGEDPGSLRALIEHAFEYCRPTPAPLASPQRELPGAAPARP